MRTDTELAAADQLRGLTSRVPSVGHAARPPTRVGLAMLTTVLFVSLGIGLAGRGDRPAADPAGFGLRADASSSKLDNTSAAGLPDVGGVAPQPPVDNRDPGKKEEGPPSAFALPPSQQDLPPTVAEPVSPAVGERKPPKQRSPDVPMPPPAFDLPPSRPAAPPAEPGVAITAPEPGGLPVSHDVNTYLVPYRGDTPMMRSWKTLGLPALLAAALTVPVARADDPPNLQGEYKTLEELQKTVLDVQKRLTEMQKSLNVLGEMPKSLAALEAIRKELQELRGTTNVNVAKAQADINELKEQVGRLERDIRALREQTAPSNQVAGFRGLGAPGTTGRILLKNTFADRVSVLINNKSYQLAPGESWLLDNQPAGAFTLEILGGPTGIIQPRVNRDLVANRTYEITVFPR